MQHYFAMLVTWHKLYYKGQIQSNLFMLSSIYFVHANHTSRLHFVDIPIHVFSTHLGCYDLWFFCHAAIAWQNQFRAARKQAMPMPHVWFDSKRFSAFGNGGDTDNANQSCIAHYISCGTMLPGHAESHHPPAMPVFSELGQLGPISCIAQASKLSHASLFRGTGLAPGLRCKWI